MSNDLILLAAYVLYEKHVNNYAGFAGPYIETLPEKCDWAPCMWTRDEMELARTSLPGLYEELVADVAAVEAEWANFKLFFENDKNTWRTDRNLTFADYCYGRMMVSSRWFGVNNAGDSTDKIKFHTRQGVTHATLKSNATYSANHLVPYLDLFNHNIVRDPIDETYFAEVSTWEMTQEPVPCFAIKTLGHGTKKGEEAFITYGSRGINEMLLHYGFLANIGLEYYEPCIKLENPESDPMHVLRHNTILTCWPLSDSQWLSIMPQHLPVEVFQRALVLQERREELLTNITYVKEHICKSSGTFANHDIETLRRNKRAMLMVLEAMLELKRSLPSKEANEAALAVPGISYTVRNLITYRENVRINLDIALDRFRSGTWRLLKQVHILNG